MAKSIIDVPIVWLDQVMHVGDLSPLSKRTNSYEGAGLSVSLHPDEWRAIARGHVTGATWVLEKSGGAFLDAHLLDDAQRAATLAWACEQGFAISADLFELSLYDDELETTLTQTFTSLPQAEAENIDELPNAIMRVSGYVSTPMLDAMSSQSRQTVGATNVVDLVLPILAERVLGLDGVWWEDDLDVQRLSAPRGVISTTKLPEWKIAPIGGKGLKK